MRGVINRLFLSLLFFLLSVFSYGQEPVDLLYERLNDKQRLALLFISGDSSPLTPGYSAVEAPVKSQSSLPGNANYLVDVSTGFTDNLQLPFPDYRVLIYTRDAGVVKSLLQSSCKYFCGRGAAGILFKYSGDRGDTNPPYLMATYLNGKFTVKRVALFDGLPLLKPMIQHEKQNLSILNIGSEHSSIKSWIGLFSNETAGLNVSFEELLDSGTLFYTNNLERSVDKLQRAIESNTVNKDVVEEYVKIALDRKAKSSVDVTGYSETEQLKRRWEVWLRSFSIVQRMRDIDEEHSFISVKSKFGVIDLTGDFVTIKSRYKNPEFIVSDLSTLDSIPDIEQILIVASKHDSVSAKQLKELRDRYKLKLIYLGSAPSFKNEWMERTGFFDKILFSPGKFHGIDLLLDQVIFGGAAVNGVIPFYDEFVRKGFGQVSYDNLRIGYGFPALVNMSVDTLKRIDSILNVAVKKKMTPGGQVMVVKDGYVVYNKSFGYTTYSRRVKVDSRKIYDLASLTKIVATMPLIMKLYDEKKIELNAQLKQYLPETDTLETGELTIKQLLLHEAGLPSYIPFHFYYVDSTSFRGSMYSGHYSRTYSIRLDRHFFFNKNVKYKSEVFSKRPDSLFSVQISKDMYMNYHYRDSVFQRVLNVKLKSDKEYLYSDVGYYLLLKVIERVSGQRFDDLFRMVIAGPLGTDALTYNPLRSYPKSDIVPSGKDVVFRKSMLQGYVNDGGAAMLGGVGAHAGLFGNTTALVGFAQMLLNKGSYGGISIIDSSTINLFTSKQNNHNRRGLGFDKPEFDVDKDTPVSKYASPSSYGHSGFTGTLMWIDPEYNLIYIFLSNRVYPDSYNRKLITENIRTKIQDIIYKSFLPGKRIKLINTVGYE